MNFIENKNQFIFSLKVSGGHMVLEKNRGELWGSECESILTRHEKHGV